MAFAPVSKYLHSASRSEARSRVDYALCEAHGSSKTCLEQRTEVQADFTDLINTHPERLLQIEGLFTRPCSV